MRLDPAKHAFLSAPDTRAVMDALSPGEADRARFVGGAVRNALQGEPVELTHPGRYVGSRRHGPHRAHRRCDDAEIDLWDNGVWDAPPRTGSGPRTADPPLA